MVIGYLINTSEPYYRGGYEQRILTFGRELVRQGHEVRVYTSCPGDEIVEGIRFIRIAPMRPFFNARGVRNGWADVLFSLAILRLLWKRGFGELEVLDVCATPFIHLPFAALVTWLRGVPACITCHEALLVSIPAYTRERGNAGGLVASILNGVFAGAYRLGTGLFPWRLANSHGTAAALAKEGYPASGVVETGLDAETYHPQPPQALPDSESVRLIFCGRLTPIKSVDQALLALFSLRGEERPFTFDIVGSGSERARLEKMVKEAGAESWVTFHGQVSDEEKRRLLGRSEIFVLSSPREGLSLATLEAMAQGCTALIVNDPVRPNGALDFIRDGENGVVVAPGMEAMREALRALIRGRDLGLRQAAWEKAKAYAVEIKAGELVEFYRGR